ncbi:major facilitator superfamily MFS_1 [Microbacterium esteraromaticum]|uniref:Major facilitator superfamily MFS_1 n=1 Tax=Microbacterium esteraromaticum TaxID=57043 RepID=A0A1R4K9C7_9MICO|nr:MFS transporter [Microbacterium esteraromaticum]SJN40920.1 major facilitator superfamily MFS_1 [Microbacterium esteraromaticum]
MSAHAEVGRADQRSVYLLAAVNLVTLGSLTAPVVAAIPLKIAAMLPEQHRATALATVLTLGGLAALLANPLFGALSDRTRGRLGRRRPWMLGGAIAGFGGIAFLAVADSDPAIIVSWVFTKTAFNAVFAAAAALLADTVPPRRRAAASGVFTAAAFVGTLPPLLLAALFPEHVVLVSFIMPLTALVVVAVAMTVPDRADAGFARAPQGIRAASFRVPFPKAFIAVWLQRLAMQLAFTLATAFTLYLVIDRMSKSPVEATPIAMVATLIGGAGVVVGAALGGAWASRIQRYLPFLVFGSLGLAAGATVRSIADAPVLLWAAAACGGLAVGTYLAVNLALAMHVIPRQRAGTYLGLLNVAEAFPQVVAPLTAAALLHIGPADPISGVADNYVILYATAAVIALLSLATLPALRHTARDLENNTGTTTPLHAEAGAPSSRM